MENKPTKGDNSSDCWGGGADPRRVAELLEEHKALLVRERAIVRERWSRSLPFGDYVVDRWEKAKALGFGEGSSIYDSALVLGDVRVGKDTWIGPFTVLDGSGCPLVVGDCCSISAGVQIYTHDTVEWAVSGGKVAASKCPVELGSRCYVGPNVIISRGVTVGEGCVIGANSFVNSNLPAGAKAWGTPARLIS